MPHRFECWLDTRGAGTDIYTIKIKMSHAELLSREIKQLGVSPEGERWLTRALYPPGDDKKVAVPDDGWSPTMLQDVMPSTVVSAHPSLDEYGDWDCLVITPPGDVTAAIVVTAPAGTDFDSRSAPFSFGVRVLKSQTGGAGIYRNLQAGAVHVSPGNVSGDTFKFVTASNPVGNSAFRHTYRSVTMHHTGSDLYNGGTVIAGQFPTRYQPGTGYTYTGKISTGGVEGQTAGVPHYANIPLGEADMTNMMPGTSIEEAREGTYVPQRLLGPSQPFAELPYIAGRTNSSIGTIAGTFSTHTAFDPTQALNSVSDNPLTIPSYPIFGASAGHLPWWQQWVTYFTNGTEHVTANITIENAPVMDTAFDEVATGVILFRGLDQKATLSLQVYQGLQHVLENTSIFGSFVDDPCPPDARAIAAYYQIASRMPMHYPASFNSFGAVIPFIRAALRSLAPIVVPTATKFAHMGVDKLSEALLAKAAGKAKVSQVVAGRRIGNAVTQQPPRLRAPQKKRAPAQKRQPKAERRRQPSPRRKPKATRR